MPSITAAPSYYNNPYRKYMDNADPGVLLILARHGSTESNDASIPLVRGWHDIDLDDNGKIQAQLLGHKMRQYDPKKVVSSDFLRDQSTANILASIINTNDVEVDSNLRTWDVGDFGGKPLIEANPVIAEMYKNPSRKPPGSGETFNEFTDRFTSALSRYLTMSSIDIYRPLLLVTHGKNIALAFTYINGGNTWDAIMPGPSGYAIISVNQDRSLSIEMSQPIEDVIEDV
jgi:broad specificity phosphatase PhoE